MDPQPLLIVVLAAVVVLIGMGFWAYTSRQRQRLRERFGPEYQRTVEEAGSAAKADAILKARAARVERFTLRPLSREQARSFAREWQRVQARFVDDPNAAVGEADGLVTQVMTARGYPVDEDFERRADDVSVDHPHVVAHYRAARALMRRRSRGEATTEELRQAIVNYRELFADLLETEDRDRRRAS